MKSIIDVQHVGLCFRSRKGFRFSFTHSVLQDVSFKIYRGETIGVIGRNGSGKSSLLKLLAGIINPTSGLVKCSPNITRSLLALGLGFMPHATGRENAIYAAMLQGASRKKAISMLKSIQDFSELGKFFDEPVNTYSAGMLARLGFSTAFYTDVDVILIDEVLSVGDLNFRMKAQQAIVEKISGDQTCVFVSHDSDQVNKLCSRAIWIEEGLIKEQGDTASVVHKYNLFMQSL